MLPSVLYHYTSTDGLIGIVRSGKLWATDIEYLNDSEELTHASADLLARIQSRIDALGGVEVADDPDDRRRSLVYVLRELRTYIGLVQNHQTRERAYVTCFCERDDLLSQWRGYAGVGGYALGFDPLKMDPVSSERFFEPRLIRVLYGVVQAQEALDDLVATLPKAPTAHPGVRASHALVPVMRMLASVKNPGFAEELEWRTVLTTHYYQEALEFRSGALGIIPYVAREFPPEAFVSVTIGPGADSTLRKRALVQLLHESLPREVASAIDIRESEVPFR